MYSEQKFDIIVLSSFAFDYMFFLIMIGIDPFESVNEGTLGCRGGGGGGGGGDEKKPKFV